MKNKKNQSTPPTKDKNNKDKISPAEQKKQERLKKEYEEQDTDTHGVYESESDYW